MQSGEAGFTFSSRWPGTAAAVELAFLGLACLKRRAAALLAGAAARGSAANALNFPAGCSEMRDHCGK